MDLLFNAYSNNSDEDDDPKPEPETSVSAPSKRQKFDAQIARPNLDRPLTRYPIPANEAPISGRYVSKRERAISEALSLPEPRALDSDDVTTTSFVFGSISSLKIREDKSSLLRNYKAKSVSLKPQMLEKMFAALSCHTKAVTAVHWSPNHAHLLASAGMDNSVCIWKPWSKDHTLARKFCSHASAVRDVKWSPQGLTVLSCGYDQTSRLVDVEKGIEIRVFREDQTVSVVKFHNDNCNMFLSGGSQGKVNLWDVRTGKTVHEYVRGREPVLDVEFTTNGKQIIVSSDISKTRVSENSIIIWDVSREVPLSKQVYVEAYTCPCVKIHPVDPVFIAQSNGNYIAIFSSSSPFKLNKYKRYEGHGVSGFPIKCSFSLDGEQLISGSSDGFIYLYDYRTSQVVRKIKAYEQACIDIAVHPVLPNVVASCSWSGEVSVFD